VAELTINGCFYFASDTNNTSILAKTGPRFTEVEALIAHEKGKHANEYAEIAQ